MLTLSNHLILQIWRIYDESGLDCLSVLYSCMGTSKHSNYSCHKTPQLLLSCTGMAAGKKNMVVGVQLFNGSFHCVLYFSLNSHIAEFLFVRPLTSTCLFPPVNPAKIFHILHPLSFLLLTMSYISKSGYGLATMFSEGVLVRYIVPYLGEINSMRLGLLAFSG